MPSVLANTSEVLAGLTLRTSTDTIALYRDMGTHFRLPRHYPWPGVVTPVAVEVDRLKFTDGVTLRDDQIPAWTAYAVAHNGLLVLACGKGKTVLTCKKIAHEGLRALVVAPAGVVPQWVEEIRRWLGFTPGVVHGTRQEWDSPVVVASSQTLVARLDRISFDIRTRFGLVVYDECHHLSAAELSGIAPLFFGRRFGLTATMERADGTEAAYLHHLGEVFYKDVTYALKPTAYFVRLDTEIDVKTAPVNDCRGELSIPRLRKLLGTLPDRNERIAAHIRVALANGRRILALTHSVEGAHLLGEILGSEVAVVITGKQRNVKVRLDAFKGDKVVIASTEIAGEALDAPHLDTLFLTTPFTSSRLLTQAPGRILRAREGKAPPIVVTFEDSKVRPLRAMCYGMRKEFIKHRFTIENVPDVIKT